MGGARAETSDTGLRTERDLGGVLVADIGGTHARFALVHRDPISSVYHVSQAVTLASADFDSVEQSLDTYLETITGSRPLGACLAVAGPIGEDRIRLTNLHWEFSARELGRRFGIENFLVVNDFAAFLAGVTVIGQENLSMVKPGVPVSTSPVAALGPGTGLGISSITRGAGGWHPVASEGGHAGFAPGNEQELEIARILMRRFGRVSLEQVISGPGMANLYEALCVIAGQKPQPRTPEQITALGLSGDDALCEQTLRVFCAILGSVAGDLALITGARGGVFLGGGVVRKFESMLVNGDFVRRFCDKGVMSDYVAQIPVYTVHGGQAALIGAAVLLEKIDGLSIPAGAGMPSSAAQ